MSASLEPRSGVIELPRAGVPADHGLASLGLLMQLAGRASGALAALIATVVVLEARVHRNASWFLFAVALCIARAQLHRIAGRDLVYSRRTSSGRIANPFDAMRNYIAFAIGHAVVLGLVATMELGATRRTGLGITGALALWPIVLTVGLQLPRFRRLHTGIPLAEDRGLEGASVLMTVLGACGVLSTAAIAMVLGQLPSRHLEHGWGVMLVVAFALLLVRSCLQLRAGLAGLRDASFDRPGELAARYASFGVLCVVCVGGVLALLAMSEGLPAGAIASVTVLCWLLAAWPVIVKRFFHHRQFAELLAGDRVLHRRAPDAGLTGLAWLLVGHAAVVVALLILAATVEHHGVGHALDRLLLLGRPAIGHSALELGIAAGIVGLELLTAGMLLHMEPCRRVIATMYALVAIGVAVVVAWPLVRSFGHHPIDLRTAIRLIPAAVQLVIPAATLVLVQRGAPLLARARYRRPVRPAPPPSAGPIGWW
jgi:hypothetical protein